MRKDSHDFDQNVDQLENLRVVDFLVDFVFSNVEGDVEESHQLNLQFLVFQTEIDLHPIHRVRLHYQLDILLEVVLYDLQFHLFLVVLAPLLRAFFIDLISLFLD